MVATYKYDPWGKITSATGTMASVNLLRYRGYYYDSETGFYYLMSRYYDPEIGRFINADITYSTGHGVLGNNMFAYCNNNPICKKDLSGCEPTEAVDVDGDGEPDYYRYDYSYSYPIWSGFLYCEQVISGSVYIFPEIGSPGNLDGDNYPESFNPSCDLLVGYYLDTSKGHDNPVMYAYQAQRVSKEAMMPIVDILLQYDSDFDTPWDRTGRSLFIEWDAHNQLSIHPSAQNVDFDNDEEGKGYFHYYTKAFKRALGLE